MKFDAAHVQKQLDEFTEDVGVQAHMDQQAAALDQVRDNGTWWAALSMLATVHDNTVATALATQHLKQYLVKQEHEQLVILGAYLLHNTINLVANQFHDGDIEAAVKSIVSDDDYEHFKRFVMTSGASCPECGFEDGWSDHVCPVAPDDAIEG